MRFKALGTYALIIVATIVGLEIVARVWDWTPVDRDAAGGDKLGPWRYDHSAEGSGDLVANQDGHWIIWFHRPYHVQTNSVGVRNTEEPVDGAFRVLAIGDSQTFGPYLANEDTWPGWTENYLRQQLGRADTVQVFNAGISSYTIADEFAYLRDKGIAFKPRLVVLAVYENDLRDLRRERNGIVTRPAAQAPSRIDRAMKTVSRGLAFVKVFNDVRTRIKFERAGVDIRRGEGERGVARSEPAGESQQAQEPQPEARSGDTSDEALAIRYGELFRETVHLLRTNNIGLAVIFIPEVAAIDQSDPSIMQPVIRKLVEATVTPFFDLTPVMRSERDPAARLYLMQRDMRAGLVGNGHLSREGNAVIGRAVADWLIGQGLVPR